MQHRLMEIAMIAGPARRVSRRSAARSPNAMFSTLSTQLHAVLLEGAKPPASDIADYYVCHRLSTYSVLEREEIIKRVPDDVRSLLTESKGKIWADSLEIDLIDFLLHYKQNRVISIVGTVGVGKSTFIRYVLFKLINLPKSTAICAGNCELSLHWKP